MTVTYDFGIYLEDDNVLKNFEKILIDTIVYYPLKN